MSAVPQNQEMLFHYSNTRLIKANSLGFKSITSFLEENSLFRVIGTGRIWSVRLGWDGVKGKMRLHG